MRKLSKFSRFTIIIFGSISFLLGTAFATSPLQANLTQEMLYPNYWLKQLNNPDKLIMTKSQIEKYNQAIIKKLPETVYNLTDYPTSINQKTLLTWLSTPSFPKETAYLNGQAITTEYYQNLKKQLNLEAVPEKIEVKYAFTVRRTDIRTFPTGDRLFDTADNREYDLFQETAIEPAEPALILSQSFNKDWYYLQTYNYRGWVAANDLALCPNRATWLNYLNQSNFLIVTGYRLRLGTNPYTPELSNLSFQMGAKLPLASNAEIPDSIGNQIVDHNYVIKLPTRTVDGLVKFQLALLPMTASVNLGYLPYTRGNILRQAFKWEGQRYGWGGMFDSVDCSGLINNIYRSFGIRLPRNTSELEKAAGKTIDLTKERQKGLRSLLPGASLQFPGHAMLYLGEINGHFYVLHALGSCGNPAHKENDGKLQRLPVNQVVITDLGLLRTNGKQLLESLTIGKQFEN